MKIEQLNNTLSVLARVTGVRMEDATVQIGKFNFTIGQLTEGVQVATGVAPTVSTGKRGRPKGSKNKVAKPAKAARAAKPAKAAKAAKPAKRSARKEAAAPAANEEKRSVGKPVSPEGMHRRELIIGALTRAEGPMALASCVQAVLPGMEKFISGQGGEWNDTVSTTQNQLIRYDLNKMTERGVLSKSGEGRETTFRIKAA